VCRLLSMRAPVRGTRPEWEGTFMGKATLGPSTARRLERRHVTRAGMARVGVLAAIGAAVWFSREGTDGALIGSAFLAVILLCDAVRSHMETGRRDALTLWLRSEEHTSELQSRFDLVCRLLLEKK